jgi:hypothetical protein
MLCRGSAGSNTTVDHLQLLDATITAVPQGLRRRLMVTCDGAGARHGLIARLDKLAARRGYELPYSVGRALAEREKGSAAPGRPRSAPRKGRRQGGRGGRLRWGRLRTRRIVDAPTR